MELYEEVLKFFKEKYKDDLLAVILFGSLVYKGKGKDIDLLVIIREDTDYFHESINTSVELMKKFNYKYIFDVHILSFNEFVDNLKVGSFLSGLALGYKILYDKVGIERYIKDFMEELAKSKYILVKDGEEYDLNKFAKLRLI